MDVGNTTGPDATPPGADDALLVGSDERGTFIAARGSIRATLCYPLRDLLLGPREESGDVGAVFVDLSRCQYMDSTFIGLLVAIDRRLRSGSAGRLHVHQPSRVCRDLLQQMGLLDLLLVEAGPIVPPALMDRLEPPVGRPATDFILGAHEALMETSEEARRKFALLREELERKLKSERPPEGSP